MNCNHEKIKSVNCEIFCLYCGEKLPIDYLVAKDRIAAQKQGEKAPAEIKTDDNPTEPATPAETPENGEKQKAPARGRKGGKK